MKLVKMPRVEEITGLKVAAIRQKISNGNFPKPDYNESKIHKWNERKIINWQQKLEKLIMELNARGYMPNTIAARAFSNNDRVIGIIEKNGGVINCKERPIPSNFFHLVLKTSAQIRGIQHGE